MTRTLRKWRALYGVYAQDWLAYKANGVIWILTDLVTAVTMPLVWANAASSGMVEGYSQGSFTAYYLAMITVGSFVTSHLMWEIGTEIREGVFTSYLIRPFSFFQTTLVRNFAWRSIRATMTIPFLIVLVLAYWNNLQGAEVYLGWQFWIAMLLGHFVSVSIVLAMSSIALWVQEATSVFELYYVPQLFLSGYMFPMSVLPGWAQQVAKATPFYYTTGVPVDVFVGRIPPDAAIPMIGMQIVWIGVAALAAKIAWRAGLKQYTGVGT